MGSDPLLQLRRISLDPAKEGRVVDRDPAVLQHQFEIAIADREHQVPAHGPQDHLGRELPALERLALRHDTCAAIRLVETARLPNPDPPHKLATDPSSSVRAFRVSLLSLSASGTRSFVSLRFLRTGKRCCSSSRICSSSSSLSSENRRSRVLTALPEVSASLAKSSFALAGLVWISCRIVGIQASKEQREKAYLCRSHASMIE